MKNLILALVLSVFFSSPAFATEVVRDGTVTQAYANSVVKVLTWTGLDGDDSGKAMNLSGYADKTIHIYGTFDSATVTVYCSNDPLVLVDRAAGTLFSAKTASWVACVDAQGGALAKTAAGIETIMENPLYILPVITGGGGSASLKVVIAAKKDY